MYTNSKSDDNSVPDQGKDFALLIKVLIYSRGIQRSLILFSSCSSAYSRVWSHNGMKH